MASRRGAVGLTKTIEHVRQKRRLNPDTCINHFKGRLRSVEPCSDADLPAWIGEFDRIRNEVPRDLLQSTGLSHHSKTCRPQRHIQLDVTRGSRGTHSV